MFGIAVDKTALAFLVKVRAALNLLFHFAFQNIHQLIIIMLVHFDAPFIRENHIAVVRFSIRFFPLFGCKFLSVTDSAKTDILVLLILSACHDIDRKRHIHVPHMISPGNFQLVLFPFIRRDLDLVIQRIPWKYKHGFTPPVLSSYLW